MSKSLITLYPLKECLSTQCPILDTVFSPLATLFLSQCKFCSLKRKHPLIPPTNKCQIICMLYICICTWTWTPASELSKKCYVQIPHYVISFKRIFVVTAVYQMLFSLHWQHCFSVNAQWNETPCNPTYWQMSNCMHVVYMYLHLNAGIRAIWMKF